MRSPAIPAGRGHNQRAADDPGGLGYIDLTDEATVRAFKATAAPTIEELDARQRARLWREYETLARLDEADRAAHRNEYVLVRGGTVVGHFKSMVLAMDEGYEDPEGRQFLVDFIS
jgi:hypothetical protein